MLGLSLSGDTSHPHRRSRAALTPALPPRARLGLLSQPPGSAGSPGIPPTQAAALAALSSRTPPNCGPLPGGLSLRLALSFTALQEGTASPAGTRAAWALYTGLSASIPSLQAFPTACPLLWEAFSAPSPPLKHFGPLLVPHSPQLTLTVPSGMHCNRQFPPGRPSPEFYFAFGRLIKLPKQFGRLTEFVHLYLTP